MSLFQQKASSTLVADAKISMTLRCACDKWTDKLAGNKYLNLFVQQGSMSERFLTIQGTFRVYIRGYLEIT